MNKTVDMFKAEIAALVKMIGKSRNGPLKYALYAFLLESGYKIYPFDYMSEQDKNLVRAQYKRLQAGFQDIKTYVSEKPAQLMADAKKIEQSLDKIAETKRPISSHQRTRHYQFMKELDLFFIGLHYLSARHGMRMVDETTDAKKLLAWFEDNLGDMPGLSKYVLYCTNREYCWLGSELRENMSDVLDEAWLAGPTKAEKPVVEEVKETALVLVKPPTSEADQSMISTALSTFGKMFDACAQFLAVPISWADIAEEQFEMFKHDLYFAEMIYGVLKETDPHKFRDLSNVVFSYIANTTIEILEDETSPGDLRAEQVQEVMLNVLASTEEEKALVEVKN